MTRRPNPHDDIADAMTTLIDAIRATGLRRTAEALDAYRDEGDPDAPDWELPFIEGVQHAVSIARRAAKDDPQARWIMISPEAGQVITWDWRGAASPDLAGMVLRSVEAAVGTADRYPTTHAALAACLPVMRRGLWEYLDALAVAEDPATITAAEMDEADDDFRAISTAQAIVGTVEDFQHVDTDFLDACISRWQELRAGDEA